MFKHQFRWPLPPLHQRDPFMIQTPGWMESICNALALETLICVYPIVMIACYNEVACIINIVTFHRCVSVLTSS